MCVSTLGRKGEEMETKKDRKQTVQRLLFYEKPLVGTAITRPKAASLPIQIIYPSSNQYQIALPVRKDRLDRNQNNNIPLYLRGDTMVVSGPELSVDDNRERRNLAWYFVIIAVINILITSMLFYNAHIADISQVIPNSDSPNTFSFVQIPKSRKYSENLIFYMTIFNLLLGIIGALIQNPLALFLYSLISMLIFFLGFPVVPYLLYSSRYLLDGVNLYIAYVLRSKLMMNILPFNFVRR